MLENINALIDSGKIEAYSPSSLLVVREVVNLMKKNKTAVLLIDLSDYDRARKVLSTEAVLDDCVMGIEIDSEIQNEDIEISVFDANLAPGTPRDKSFSYRVNLFGGPVAEKYRGSIGYALAEEIFENVEKDGYTRILSDNWSETNVTPKEILDLFQKIKYLRLPKYDPRESTKSGTPRYIPFTEE